MTEIVMRKIPNRGICVVDNHRGKTGKRFTILVSGLSEYEAENYMKIKGM